MMTCMRTAVLLGLMLAMPVPALAFQSAADVAVEPCSAAAIKAAAAQSVAPQLTGCSIKTVAGPLMASFRIIPATHEVAGKAKFGTIVAQAPTAGAPLKSGGKLSLDVSTGLPAREPNRERVPSVDTSSAASSEVKPDVKPETVPTRPQTEASAEPAASESASAVTEVTPPVVSAAASEASSAEPAPSMSDPSSLWRLIQTYPLYAGLALVALVALLAISLRPKRPKARAQASLPPVSCTLTYGPGRLTSQGPLVTGERRGE